MAPVFPACNIRSKRSGETGVRGYVGIGYPRRIVLGAPDPGHRQIEPVQQMHFLALRTGNRKEQQKRQYEQAFHGSGDEFDDMNTGGNTGYFD